MFGFSPRPCPAAPSLKPLGLFGGLDVSQLWPLTNLVLPAWLLLALLPTWRHTPTLTLVPPFVHSVLYVAVLLSNALNSTEEDAPIDFSSFEGVTNLFKDPTVVFAGWVHYLVFDLLIGRAIVEDALSRDWTPLRHALVIVPCLFMTLMFGPTGFLLYSCIAASGLLGAKGISQRELDLRLERLKAA